MTDPMDALKASTRRKFETNLIQFPQEGFVTNPDLALGYKPHLNKAS